MGKVAKKIVWTFFVGMILVYGSYHVFAMLFPSVKTEVAHIARVYDSIDADGYIIRDEQVIPDDLSGFISFCLSDADKIGKDGVVARVYGSESQGILHKKAEEIEKEIARLETLKNFGGFALSSNPASIDQKSYLEFNSFIKNVNNCEFNTLPKHRDNIFYLLNERQIASRQDLSLDEKISGLKNELNKLSLQENSSAIKKILAQHSGYFMGTVDGFEDAFNYDSVKNITAEQVKALLNESSALAQSRTQNAAKLVVNSNWFVVCALKRTDALQLSLDQYVELVMPLASAEKIRAKVVAINQSGENSESAVVFQCDYIDKNTLSIRNEPIKINISEYRGLSVSKSAVHEKTLSRTIADEATGQEKVVQKAVKGVYVRRGKQLAFREIDIIFSGDDFVICSLDADKSKLFSENTIKEYDEVVVKGRDLYDGKFV